MLERAGIEQADGLAAVTNSDAVNAVVGHVARTVYNVPNVVVAQLRPALAPLHEAFGLQVVSSTAWGAQRIEELLEQPAGMRPVLSAGNGEVEVYELACPTPGTAARWPSSPAGGECTPVGGDPRRPRPAAGAGARCSRPATCCT